MIWFWLILYYLLTLAGCLYLIKKENNNVLYKELIGSIFFGWIAFYLFLSGYLITTDFWNKKVF